MASSSSYSSGHGSRYRKPHVEGGQTSVASTEGGNEKDDSARRLMKRTCVDYGVGVVIQQSWRQASIEMRHTCVSKSVRSLEGCDGGIQWLRGRGQRGNAARPEVKHCRRRVYGTGPRSNEDLP